MAAHRSLVSPTSHPALERALLDKLQGRGDPAGSLGDLEMLALRLGLMQRSLKPRLDAPQLLVLAADHGLAVDGLHPPGARPTHETVSLLLAQRLPLMAFARAQQVGWRVVDCGLAHDLPPHERLLARKIAHGTRHARVAAAMTLEQAHAGLRAGMEIGDQLRGGAVLLAGIGVGADESAALVMARLSATPLEPLLRGDADPPEGSAGRRLRESLAATLARHAAAADPVEVLAAMGGFECAVMAGVVLMAASRRQLLLVDGLPACAALMVAARIAPPVTDYCVFCRSHGHPGLDRALALFRASALPGLDIDALDGTGALLAWPLVRAAAALLTEVGDGEDPGPTHP